MGNLILFFIITTVIECFLALILFFKIPHKKTLLVVISANLLTNPLANYLILLNTQYFHNPLTNIYTLELVVVVVEAFIISKYLHIKTIKALLASILMNTVSFFVGYIAFIIISSLISIVSKSFQGLSY